MGRGSNNFVLTIIMRKNTARSTVGCNVLSSASRTNQEELGVRSLDRAG